jgi:cytoskeleton protein RodZ
LRRGDDLVAVARVLRIRLIYLNAIEDGRFGDLPGPTYAVGFVRAYAEHLGLDSDEVIRRFKDEVSGINGTAELHFPSPRSEGGTPKWAVLIGGAIFALLSYGVWYVNSTRDDVVAEFVTSVPERLGQLLSGDETDEGAKTEDGSSGPEDSSQPSPSLAVAATTASNQPGETPRTDAASRLVEPVSEGVSRLPSEQEAGEETTARSSAAPDSPVTEATPAPTPGPSTDATQVATAGSSIEAPRAPTTGPGTGTTSSLATTPEQAADEPTGPMVNSVVAAVDPGSEPGLSPEGGGRTGTSFGNPEEARIVLRATAESWIQVRDETTDRVLLARLLRPGDVYRVPNRSGLNLWTGNAGGLEILVDGEPVPSIGETGVVRRRVVLEVEPLRTGAAVR